MSLSSERKLGGVCKAGSQVTKTCKGPEVENSWTVREASVTEQLEMDGKGGRSIQAIQNPYKLLEVVFSEKDSRNEPIKGRHRKGQKWRLPLDW